MKILSYKVINRFKEKNHDGHVYEIGDDYPAAGKKLVKTRAESLTKVHPEYGVAFLQANEEKPAAKKTAAAKATEKVENEVPEKSDV